MVVRGRIGVNLDRCAPIRPSVCRLEKVNVGPTREVCCLVVVHDVEIAANRVRDQGWDNVCTEIIFCGGAGVPRHLESCLARGEWNYSSTREVRPGVRR